MAELATIIERIFGRYALLIRYVMSGTTAFVTNILSLYIFTEYLKLYYLVSATIAFFLAFIVSFFMMKYWTFQDQTSEKTFEQLVLYFVLMIFNLFLNTVLIYLFVEYAGVWYILSQVFASLLIAIFSFFVYRFIIFKI